MSAFTPGPWSISGGALRIVSNNEWVATVEGANPENGLAPTPTKALANARLIAVAPEMFSLLKEMTFVVESVAHLRGLERELLPLTDRARELLKQAENP